MRKQKMKMYIFEKLDNVSDRYHSNGGLMVVAKDLDDLKEIIKEYQDIIITEKEFKEILIYELKDNNVERKVIVFPDAGCC
jgi:hypothetical protein